MHSLQCDIRTLFLTEIVKGGLITYTADVLDEVNLATANFAANNSDPKAAIITAYNYLLGEVCRYIVLAENKYVDSWHTAWRFGAHFLRWPHTAEWGLRRILGNPLVHPRHFHSLVFIACTGFAFKCNLWNTVKYFREVVPQSILNLSVVEYLTRFL